MAGEHHGVHAGGLQGAEVQRQVGSGLAGVQDNERTDLLGAWEDEVEWADRTGDVGGVSQGQDAGSLGDDVQGGGIDAPVLGQVQPAQGGAGAGAQLLPGHEVGVVLSTGDDHLVALSDDEAPSRVIGRGGPSTAGRRPALAGVPDGQSHEVDGLGGVLGEDELTAARADEGGDGVAGVLEGGGGLVGELVGRAPRRAVGHAVEVGLRGDDAGGLLARGRPVQVGQSLAVAGGPLQVGEVGADRGDLLRVERAGRRRPGEWGRGLSHDVPFRFGAGRFRAWSPTAGAEVTRNLSPPASMPGPATAPCCAARRRRPRHGEDGQAR